MLLPQTAEYALRAALHLAARDGTPVRATEMAAVIGVPQNYLSKTLHQLARAGVLRSARGPAGGFRLAAPPTELSLARVIAPFVASSERRCLIGHGPCGETPSCPTHALWAPVARQLDAFFAETTLADLLTAPAGGGEFTDPPRSPLAAGRPSGAPHPRLS